MTKPGAVKGIKIKGAKKKFTIKWKKGKNVSGYKIKLSLKKNLKGAKTIIVKGTDKTSTVVKKLKAKTYYVRICAYNEAGNGKWSKTKKVKVKK